MSISNNGFVFCTWNVGAEVGDYRMISPDLEFSKAIKEVANFSPSEKTYFADQVVNKILATLNKKKEEINNEQTEAFLTACEKGESIQSILGQFFDPTDTKESSPMDNIVKHANSLESKLSDLVLDVKRNRLLKEVATKIISQDTDAMALQEIFGDERAEINSLISANYEIIRPLTTKGSLNTRSDTGIALKTDKFDKIENRSFLTDNGDVSIAVAIKKDTRKKIAFVSMHAAGFRLTSQNILDQSVSQKNQLESEFKEAVKNNHDTSSIDALREKIVVLERTIENLKNQKKDPKKAGGADIGDEELKSFLKAINSKTKDCDQVVIGVDMNATPELYKNRFNLFTKAGYKLKRSNTPTNIYKDTRLLKPVEDRRELDYVFVRTKFPGFINFLKRLFNRDSINVSPLLKLDPNECPSDHIPLITKFFHREKIKNKDVDFPQHEDV